MMFHQYHRCQSCGAEVPVLLLWGADAVCVECLCTEQASTLVDYLTSQKELMRPMFPGELAATAAEGKVG